MLEVKDSTFDLPVFCDKINASLRSKEQARAADLLILPIIDYKESSEPLFNIETVDFLKYVKNNNDICVAILTADTTPKLLALHSQEFRFPTIYIRDMVLVPIAIGLITGYIFDACKGLFEKEPPVVSFKIIIEKQKTEISFQGSAEGLKDVLDKIDSIPLDR